MDMQLRDRVVLVTGGASGIGRACTEVLAEESATVLIVDRNPEGSTVASQLRKAGHWVEFVQADLTDESDVRMVAHTARDLFGRLDSVIACAGISGPVGQPAAEVSVEDWDRVMAVNVRGNFLVAKHSIPLLSRSEAPSVVFLGSDSALVGFEGMTPYCTSKGAVLMLTKSLTVDYPQIRFNCLCPGIVDTPMSRADLGQDEGFAGAGLPVMQPGQVARHAVFLASPVSAPINGTTLVADFGYTARSALPTLGFS
ncbi:short-chain dehydrogenase [Zafaria cholistanensis]|uniref:Short-chain dehydrogenase n=1 Tax=Zafaria cholistanensis TaxID=1682741 RepID=A0A5A7NUE2_9MICC|nr:SDR family oxidoreductase [Zafaria cholistanensis]GER24440.1 short-chain dehydrogenase [Zafaria cholistanensis]